MLPSSDLFTVDCFPLVKDVEGVGRFGASAPFQLQDCQMSEYPAGYQLKNLLYVHKFG
jgi:hypothetical protein